MSAAPETEGPLDGRTLIKDGWFMEKNQQWPGQANSLEVKEVLSHCRSDFQDVLVFESTTWGKVLVLDGVIQLTERDEMSYQEMLAHIPMFSHPDPKSVLIVGGGDGGMLREVVKHTGVEHVKMCEIDGKVIEASKEYFPKQSTGFADPRADLLIGDGLAFARAAADETYDVIIVDSSDPVGPADGLFSKDFYANAHRILKPNGILATQGECLWVNGEFIEILLKENLAPFASAEYASIQVPTYPSGQIGCCIGRKAGATSTLPSCREPAREVPADMDLRYYSKDMHQAAFALPAFMAKRLSALGK